MNYSLCSNFDCNFMLSYFLWDVRKSKYCNSTWRVLTIANIHVSASSNLAHGPRIWDSMNRHAPRFLASRRHEDASARLRFFHFWSPNMRKTDPCARDAAISVFTYCSNWVSASPCLEAKQDPPGRACVPSPKRRYVVVGTIAYINALIKVKRFCSNDRGRRCWFRRCTSSDTVLIKIKRPWISSFVACVPVVFERG